MIVLLGASGYVGRAFSRAFSRLNIDYLPLSRQTCDYSLYHNLVSFLKDIRPAFLINAAGYTGKPNVDACELNQAETLLGNTLLPVTISHACDISRVPWGHVSSGCIYQGAKITGQGQALIEKDLLKSPILKIAEAKLLQGFGEDDPPNFSFRAPPCSFYSGTKALAEEALANDDQAYIWRLRIPFNELDSPRNYLSKLQTYERVYDNYNSLSHLGDFVEACLSLWQLRVPFGTYNVTNPGYVSARFVVSLIETHLRPPREFRFWENDVDFYRLAAKAPRSNCILDTAKLAATGVVLRPVEEALEHALINWRKSESRI